MGKFLAITGTALQETLRRRVFYVVLLLALLIIAAIGSQMFFMKMAREAGETQILTAMGVQLMQATLGIWNFAGFFLALFLGAIAVSSEISAKTIVHVMSRPVERSIYLLGRWTGVLIFLFIFLFVGISGALLLSVWLHVPFAPTLWLAIAEIYVTAILFSGVALSFSVFTPPVLAGVLAFLLATLPSMVHSAIHNPRWFYRVPALIAYYIGPAQMPVDLMSESFAKERVHADYGLYLSVLGENFLYAVAALLLATAVFRCRELRVR